MTQQEKEKMFLDLNGVLVKFWIEQGRPDKEIKIELLERMLNWYRKMGYCTLDKQEPSLPSDVDEAAEKFVYDWAGLSPTERRIAERAYLAGAEWRDAQMPMPEDTVIFQKGVEEGKRLMLEGAMDGEIDWYDGPYLNYTTEQMLNAIESSGAEVGDKVKVIIVKED